MQNLNWYKQNIDLEKFILSSGCGFIRDRTSNKNSIKLYIPGRDRKKDTVLIITRDRTTNNQIYWNVTDFGFDRTFTIIDFVQHFILHNTSSNFDFKKIVGIIKDRSSYIQINTEKSLETSSKPKTQVQDLLITPLTDNKYFFKRAIKIEIFSNEAFKNAIYSVKAKNPDKAQYSNTGFAFKSLTGIIQAILIRYFIGEKSFSRFIGDKSNSIWYSKITEKATKLIITESPEDALSYCQLHNHEMNESLYCATGGEISQNQFPLIFSMAEQYRIKQIYLAFDNDLQGLIYRLKTFLYLQNQKFETPLFSWTRHKEIASIQIPKNLYRPLPLLESAEDQDNFTLRLNLSSEEIRNQIDLLFKTYHLNHFDVINVYSQSKDFNQDIINQNNII